MAHLQLFVNFTENYGHNLPSGNIGFGMRIDETWDWIEHLNSSNKEMIGKIISQKRTSEFEYNPLPTFP